MTPTRTRKRTVKSPLSRALCLDGGATGVVGSVASVVVRATSAWVVLALCLASLPAQAVTVFQKSTFTTLDRTLCKTLRTHPDGNTYLCPGLPGYPVYFAEGDLRTYIAASTAPETTVAAQQTLRAFNSPFPRGTSRATLEWRFTIKNGQKVPFALIVRYFTEMDGAKGEVLVVARIAGSESCQIARIDALANDTAIVLARELADDRARKSVCPAEPSIEGARGKSPM